MSDESEFLRGGRPYNPGESVAATHPTPRPGLVVGAVILDGDGLWWRYDGEGDGRLHARWSGFGGTYRNTDPPQPWRFHAPASPFEPGYHDEGIETLAQAVEAHLGDGHIKGCPMCSAVTQAPDTASCIGFHTPGPALRLRFPAVTTERADGAS